MSAERRNERRPAPPTETSQRIARARVGDGDSVSWLVTRFSPTLMVQATHRLGPRLRSLHDAEDLVADVWAVVIPRLATLKPGDAETAAFLRFLSTTLMYLVNNLVRKHIQAHATAREADLAEGSGGVGFFQRLAAETTGIVTRAVRGERQAALHAALDELDPEDREIVILRGIEQSSNQAVAAQLGLLPNTVSRRYARALKKLKDQLPDSVFADLAED